MTRQEANEMLIKRFKELNDKAATIANGENNMELCALCDSAHKLYITLSNAGAFDEEIEPGPVGSKLMN